MIVGRCNTLSIMEFILKTSFNTTAKKIYETWLASEGHTKMTGGSAIISDKIGAKFTAWDGYIEGENIDLEPNKRILQSWRTSQFNEDEEDSKIEVLLNEVDGKTELTLIHTNLSETGEHYKKGWQDHYFEPMAKYFEQ
jgi:activator of HSP90 ATPase